MSVRETADEPGPSSADAGEGFESLFRANYDDLLRYALRRVGADAAKDVVAEVFLVAWRRRADLPSGRERVWLYGVAANVIANEQRTVLRQARLESRVTAAVPPDQPDPGDQAATGVWVRAVLATLPPAEQEALRLIEWDQLDIAEAAAVMGCTRAAFRVRLHRARRRFAARLAASDTRDVRS